MEFFFPAEGDANLWIAVNLQRAVIPLHRQRVPSLRELLSIGQKRTDHFLPHRHATHPVRNRVFVILECTTRYTGQRKKCHRPPRSALHVRLSPAFPVKRLNSPRVPPTCSLLGRRARFLSEASLSAALELLPSGMSKLHCEFFDVLTPLHHTLRRRFPETGVHNEVFIEQTCTFSNHHRTIIAECCFPRKRQPLHHFPVFEFFLRRVMKIIYCRTESEMSIQFILNSDEAGVANTGKPWTCFFKFLTVLKWCRE